MQKANLFNLFIIVLFISCNTQEENIPIVKSDDNIQVYRAPEEIIASNLYKVTVTQNNKSYNSYTYKNISDDPADAKINKELIKGINETPELLSYYTGGKSHPIDTGKEISVSWSTFSFKDSVTISVDYLNGNIEAFKVMPKSKGIKAKQINNTLQFDLAKPQKLAVIINHDYLNPLFLFADGPEMDIPNPNKPGVVYLKSGENYLKRLEELKQALVVYFEPGVHHLDTAFPVFSNQTIYIPGGAYLHGSLHGMMANNVTIRGRGVISGENIPRDTILSLKRSRKKGVRYTRMKYHNINMLGEGNKKDWNIYASHAGIGCDNLLIEGITIVDASHFFLRLTGVPITVHNVKMVGGWHHNSDGISAIGQDNTTIFDCFFHCNDDAVYINPNNLHVHNCVFWHGSNGSVFQFSWGGDPKKQGGGYIHDCDVIMAGYSRENNNRSVIGSRRSGPGEISDILFKNIRIEGPVWRVFRINTYYRRDNEELASINKIYFENFDIEGPVLNKNEIISSVKHPEGKTVPSSVISDIYFKNVTVSGKPISQNDFILGNENVKDIYFMNE